MYILFVSSLLYHVALPCILYLLYGTVTKVEHLWVAINANLHLQLFQLKKLLTGKYLLLVTKSSNQFSFLKEMLSVRSS